MKMVDSNALHELKAWVFDTDQNILSNHIRYHSRVEITRIRYLATIVADKLHKTHPTYETQLRGIANRLFSPVTLLGYTLNPCLFGQLYLIINHVSPQPQNEFWSNIHPRIINVSQSLYADDYYDSDAEKALREVETYMRKLHAKFKPEKGDPQEIRSIKEALPNMLLINVFCKRFNLDTSTVYDICKFRRIDIDLVIVEVDGMRKSQKLTFEQSIAIPICFVRIAIMKHLPFLSL